MTGEDTDQSQRLSKPHLSLSDRRRGTDVALLHLSVRLHLREQSVS